MNAFGLSSLLVIFFCFGLGLFVYLKNPKRKLNRLWFLLSLSIAVWGAGGLSISLLKEPYAALLAWRWTGVLGITWIPVFFYQFICELCALSRPKTILIHYLIAITSCILYLTTDLLFKGTRYLFGEFYWNEIGPLHPFYLAWWTFLVLDAHFEAWKAFRRSTGILRDQLKWTFIAFALGFSFGILGFLPNYHVDLYPWGNFAIPLYPVIMAYGIFRYQLFDIRVVIRRSLAYSILVTTLTIGYFGTISLIEHVFQTQLGYRSPHLSIIAFILMALLFQPLKISIQRLVDWVVFRAPQEELARKLERLEQETHQTEKLRAVATMAAGLCHELRNPLQAIQTYAEFLPEKYDQSDFREKCSAAMTTEISRINDLLAQLMDFAKPKSPSFTVVEPHKILDSTLDLLTNEFLKKEVVLEKNYRADGAQIKADPDQIRQVVLNLVLNALQAVPKKGRIIVSTDQKDGRFNLEIADNGPGIDPKVLPKLFEPFTTTKPDGNGLGLSVAHSIIKEHHGKISAQNSPSGGAVFSIQLPAHQSPDSCNTKVITSGSNKVKRPS